MLAKNVSGEELARELISILSITYNIAPGLLFAAMRDQTSVNTAALRIGKMVYFKMIDISCFSHTLDRAAWKTVLHSTPYRVYQRLDYLICTQSKD